MKKRFILSLLLLLAYSTMLIAGPLDDAVRNREWGNVIKLASDGISKDSKDGDSYRYLGIAKAATGDTAAAVDNLKRAISISKKDGKAVLALTGIYIGMNNIIDARQLANEGTKAAGKNLDMQASRALVLAYTDSISAASTLIWSVVSKDSTNATYYKIQGLISRKEGVLDFVIDAFNKALIYDPKDNDIRYEMAMALLSGKRGNEALEALQKINQTEPNYPGVNYQIGKILYYNARSDSVKLKEAVPYLETSIKEKPNAEAFRMLGEAYLKLNRISEAETVLRAALAKKEDASVRKLLADILMAGKKFDLASDLWKPLVGTPDFDANRFLRLVDITTRFWSQDTSKRIVFINQIGLMKQVYLADTTQRNFLGKIGLLYYTIDQYDSAASWYRRKLALEPKNDTTWINLGYALKELDRSDDAIAAIRTGLAINNTNIAPYGVIVDILQKSKREKDAISLLDSISTRKDFDLNMYIRLAGLHYGAKQYSKSLSVLEKADAAFPNSANVWLWSGINWYMRYAAEPGNTGYLSKAKSAFQKALQFDPNNAEAKDYLKQLNK